MYESYSVDLTPAKARIILKNESLLNLDLSSCRDELVELSKKDLVQTTELDVDLIQSILDHDGRGTIRHKATTEILFNIAQAAKLLKVEKIILGKWPERGQLIPNEINGIKIDKKQYDSLTPEMWQNRDKIMYVYGQVNKFKYEVETKLVSELPKAIIVSHNVDMKFLSLPRLRFYNDYLESFSI